MDRATAERLSALTNDFYAHEAQSFSATRKHAWLGWNEFISYVGSVWKSGITVLDCAAGNLRFERFLVEKLAHAKVWAFDMCDELASNIPQGIELIYQHVNLANTDVCFKDAPACDLAVCFGFMHHLPRREQRAHLFSTMLAHTKPHGYCVVSFWQFEDDARLKKKAEQATKSAQARYGLDGLGEHDYLLAWQDTTDVFRYCHSFTEQEISELVADVCGEAHGEAREVARFSADGKAGTLNRYVVLERTSNA